MFILDDFKKEHKEFRQLMDAKEVFWLNPKSYYSYKKEKAPRYPFSQKDICEVADRLERFSSYLMIAFPEIKKSKGIIESPLIEITKMQQALAKTYGKNFPGKLLMKCDNQLPISGSIKARGGIHEVLKFAEEIALSKGYITMEDNYAVFAEPKFRELFSKYSVAVGSTGNLGLSIGIMSAKLGFQVTIHMSADARQWKKDMLRAKGAVVVEYSGDYQKAVSEGRKEASKNSLCHFVDDEGSSDLFLGYAVAAARLQNQLNSMDIKVDENHPLFVYLPCGVGGGPGGVTFGLKEIYGENVHCFFSEPTQAPCMLLGILTGLCDKISCSDIGLHGKTAADGLAVGRASRLVGKIMETQLDGLFTIKDEQLFSYLRMLADAEGFYIEPSSCATFPGPNYVFESDEYLKKLDLRDKLNKATHIIWATGGAMVPKEDMRDYYEKGR